MIASQSNDVSDWQVSSMCGKRLPTSNSILTGTLVSCEFKEIFNITDTYCGYEDDITRLAR